MRTWLYRSGHPEGQIFDTVDAIAEAIHDGWVDSPGDDPNPDDGTDADDEGEDAALKDILIMTVPVAREAIMAATSAAALRAILKHA